MHPQAYATQGKKQRNVNVTVFIGLQQKGQSHRCNRPLQIFDMTFQVDNDVLALVVMALAFAARFIIPPFIRHRHRTEHQCHADCCINSRSWESSDESLEQPEGVQQPVFQLFVAIHGQDQFAGRTNNASRALDEGLAKCFDFAETSKILTPYV